MISWPSRKPRADVRGPTTLLNENSWPGLMIVPSMKSAIRWTLWIRFDDEAPMSVVNETSCLVIPRLAERLRRHLRLHRCERDVGDPAGGAVRRGGERRGSRDGVEVVAGARGNEANARAGEGEARVHGLAPPRTDERLHGVGDGGRREGGVERGATRLEAEHPREPVGAERAERGARVAELDRSREHGARAGGRGGRGLGRDGRVGPAVADDDRAVAGRDVAVEGVEERALVDARAGPRRMDDRLQAIERHRRGRRGPAVAVELREERPRGLPSQDEHRRDVAARRQRREERERARGRPTPARPAGRPPRWPPGRPGARCPERASWCARPRRPSRVRRGAAPRPARSGPPTRSPRGPRRPLRARARPAAPRARTCARAARRRPPRARLLQPGETGRKGRAGDASAGQSVAPYTSRDEASGPAFGGRAAARRAARRGTARARAGGRTRGALSRA